MLFLDADDCFLYANALRIIAACLRKERTDILRTTCFKNIDNDFADPMAEFEGALPPVRRFTRNDYFATASFSNAIWDSCFRRSLIVENQLRFREHVAFEDTDWLLIALYHARTIGIMDFPFYGYRQTRSSTTRTPHIDALHANAQGVLAALHYFDADHIDPSVRRIVHQRVKTSTVGFFRALGRYKVTESVFFLREIRQRGLLDTSLYTLTAPERFKLTLMRLLPLPLCASLRFLVLCKRRILSLTH